MAVFFGTGCLHLAIGLGEYFVVHFGTKKTWIPTIVVPRIEALALPDIQKRQREAHANMLYIFIPQHGDA